MKEDIAIVNELKNKLAAERRTGFQIIISAVVIVITLTVIYSFC